MVVDPDRNGGKEAFKSHVLKVNGRNEDADNQLMGLGSGLDEIIRGKLRIENINKKPTEIENLYMIEEGLNMMHRRNKDDFPEYAKDGTFTRAIVDPTQSPTKAKDQQDVLKKASLVNQASSMKAKNNA